MDFRDDGTNGKTIKHVSSQKEGHWSDNNQWGSYVLAGDYILYEVKAKNNGDNATDITIVDDLDKVTPAGSLGEVFKMMGYLQLRDGDFEVNGIDFDEDSLILQMKLPCRLPAAFSNNTGEFYITGEDELVNLLIKPVNGRIRQYYNNYKSYDYLPGEDMAVPKSISRFMEKGLKQSATRDTCYTWFACSGEFLQNTSKQKQYLTHTMEYLFWKLERV